VSIRVKLKTKFLLTKAYNTMGALTAAGPTGPINFERKIRRGYLNPNIHGYGI
jgi:hypothetical protein